MQYSRVTTDFQQFFRCHPATCLMYNKMLKITRVDKHKLKNHTKKNKTKSIFSLVYIPYVELLLL